MLCEEQVLLALRSPLVSEPGLWALPGGRVEDGETSEDAAVREGVEELGSLPPLEHMGRYADEDGHVRYDTFVARVAPRDAREWLPRLNWENAAVGWFPLDRLPEPLHPKLAETIERLVG